MEFKNISDKNTPYVHTIYMVADLKCNQFDITLPCNLALPVLAAICFFLWDLTNSPAYWVGRSNHTVQDSTE